MLLSSVLELQPELMLSMDCLDDDWMRGFI